jgi:pseudaminic acid synthase
MRECKIGARSIGLDHPPFVIAEMSGNHGGSLERALGLVDAAADSGAHALKIQTYTADTLTLDIASGDFLIADKGSLWEGRSLHDLYEEAHTPWEWHEAIFDRARERGLICFSTPFDETAVDFLEGLDVPCYKIASFENAHLPLIRKVAQTGKPLIISTGMATLAELDEAARCARDAGCRELIMLKCTSSYPASPADSNILTLPHLRETFGCEVGLSDHTLGLAVSLAAVALGAVVIERHFTLDRSAGGVDAAFSLEPAEMKMLVGQSENAWLALGGVAYGATEQETSSMRFRRSLYVAEDMKAGEEFTSRNLRIVRPGFGLAPRYYDSILGRRASRDLVRGTAVDWDVIG